MTFKSCPFCGSGNIQLANEESPMALNGVWEIYCANCYARMSTTYVFDCYVKGDKEAMKQEAISKWNRRDEIRRNPSKASEEAECND